ncbi:MAG: PqqD family protein [Oscillospiraceae bacterium]|nr:PqqD family protein [Oscillospiraceae bacterium]
MKISKDFVLRDVGDKTVAVPIGKASRTRKYVVKLNGTAKFIWECLAAEKTEEETVAAMAEKYQITEERATTSYRLAVQKFADAGVLVD